MGFAMFAVIVLVFPLLGYSREDSALLALVFAIPPFMVFYLGEKGYFRGSGTWRRKLVLYGSASGLVLGPPIALACVVTGQKLVAWTILLVMVSDAAWVIRAMRWGGEEQATNR
jgi:hypothetical protein